MNFFINEAALKSLNFFLMALLVGLLSPNYANAQFMENLFEKGMETLSQDKTLTQMGAGLSEESIISGLKEALAIGAGKAIGFTSKLDGYLGNPTIKIPMPEKIQNVADMLGNIGFQKPVDDFILSMNRAAESASPQAKEFLLKAVQDMNFDDAKKILNGGDTAATEYLKGKTFTDILSVFKPVVSETMNNVGVTAKYKEMMSQFATIPFASAQSLDLDQYVTDKAMAGLFLMLGEEEKKIRTNPQARVTDVLKEVFN
jgi:hypothetical protein